MLPASSRFNFSTLSLAGLALSIGAVGAGLDARGPAWSKKGADFPAACYNEKDWGECKPLQVRSPDGKSVVVVGYKNDPEEQDIKEASVTVFSNGKKLGEVVPVGLVDDEIVWSPDSKAFFITGNSNANAWDAVAVHRIDDPELGPGFVTGEVEKDMARSFPPCRAKYYHPDNCAHLAAHPHEYIGVLGLDWVGGSSGIVVMAEVPCSSYFGGIMCQVLGYEVEVPSGKILKRMEPKEFKRLWQKSMAWKFRIPDAPEYEKN